MSSFDVINFERQGNTETDIHLNEIEEIRDTINKMVSSALTTIKIFTPDLEQNIYDNEVFRQSLLNFSRGNRHASIQILVTDLSSAIHNGHSLLRLAQQLPSCMQIRNTAEDYQHTNISFMLMDQSAFVFKADINNHNLLYNAHCKNRAHKLLEFFTPIWEHAEQSASVRQLSI